MGPDSVDWRDVQIEFYFDIEDEQNSEVESRFILSLSFRANFEPFAIRGYSLLKWLKKNDSNRNQSYIELIKSGISKDIDYSKDFSDLVDELDKKLEPIISGQLFDHSKIPNQLKLFVPTQIRFNIMPFRDIYNKGITQFHSDNREIFYPNSVDSFNPYFESTQKTDHINSIEFVPEIDNPLMPLYFKSFEIFNYFNPVNPCSLDVLSEVFDKSNKLQKLLFQSEGAKSNPIYYPCLIPSDLIVLKHDIKKNLLKVQKLRVDLFILLSKLPEPVEQYFRFLILKQIILIVESKLNIICHYCGRFSKYRKNKRFCSEVMDKRDCSKSYHSNKDYNTHRSKRKEASKLRMREIRTLQKLN